VPIASSAPRPTRSSYPLIAAAVLTLATFAAYHNSFSGPFVYDDVPGIKDNPTILHPSHLGEVLSPPDDSGITVNGRPLVNLTLAINYAIGGFDVASYHVVNLLIHLCAGLSLFGLVRRSLQFPMFEKTFGRNEVGLATAFCVALLWIVHPLQTESVTYIIQRAESLVGMFYILTLYCFTRSVTSPRPVIWQILTVVSCVCGCASKEVMASAPLLVLLYDRAIVSGSFRAAWQRHQRLYLALACTWIFIGWLSAGTHNRGGTAGFGAGGISSWDYALTSSRAIGIYLKLAFWPSPLVFDYGVGLEHHLGPVLPQSLLILTIVGLTGYALWKKPVLGFLGLWFLAILGPSSSIIPIASETIAEHRMYLPLAAIITLVVGWAFALWGRAALAIFVPVALACIVATIVRNKDYADEFTLWHDAQVKFPENARAFNNVGEILYRQKKSQEALACFREAVRLLPNYIDGLNNLGNTLTQLGNPTEALTYLNFAAQLKNDYPETFGNLGGAYYKLNRLPEAIASYAEAIRLRPNFANAHSNLGQSLQFAGRPAEAVPHFETAIALKPDHVDAHANFGITLSKLGRTQEAKEQFEITLRLDPTHYEAHDNLAVIAFNQGQFALAKAHCEAALKLKPDDAAAHNNLGSALSKLGELAGARREFERTLELKPGDLDARKNLALFHTLDGRTAYSAGDLNTARAEFEAALRLVPEDAGAHNNLGMVYWRAGLLKEALPFFEKAVTLNPQYESARQSLEDLKKQLSGR
jgi:tetratricopeptide (TPR) repeat protein